MIALLGAAAGVGAWWLQSGLLWVVAFAVAAYGWGVLFEHATRTRVSAALTASVGLSAWLVVSTLLARIGVLGRGVEITLAGAGIAASGLSRLAEPNERWPRPRPALAFGCVAGTGLVLAALAVLRRDISFADGFNHSFAVKRLWDTGSLGGIPHQLGAHVVGEAYAALMSGAAATGLFEAICGAGVLWLVANEHRARERASAELLFVLVVAIVLVRTPPWSGVLFHLAAFCALRRNARWHVAIVALALVAMRHELAWLAVPYALAAFAPAKAPRGAGWIVGILTAPGWLLIRALGTLALRSPLGVACIAVTTATLAIPLVHHDVSSTTASWLGLGLAVTMSSDAVSRHRPEGYVRFGAFAAVVALLAVSLAPALFRLGDEARLRERYADAVVAAQERRGIGRVDEAHARVHALQLQIPAHACLAFWGRDAADLEFARNRIRDLSKLEAPRPITTASLRDCDYLLVEPITYKVRDPWLDRGELVQTQVTGELALEPIGSAGIARLYRVIRAPTPAPPG